jgi:Spy/CpxP family protein refolding chaperone
MEIHMRTSIAPRHAALALALVAAGLTATTLAAQSGRGGKQRFDAQESDEPGERRPPRRPPGPPPPLDAILERHADELGIDDATLGRIRAIADEVRDDMDAGHDAVRAAHEALRSLAETPDATQAQIEAAARQLGDAEAAVAVLHVTTAQRMLALLTPEQRAALRDLAPPPPPQGGERPPRGSEDPR